MPKTGRRQPGRPAKRWDAREARRVLEECERSGRGVEAFARENGIAPQRLYWWRRRLGEAQQAEAKPISLAPAKVVAVADIAAGGGGAGHAMAEVHVRFPGDVSIEIVNTSPSWVAALIRELESRS